jgi:hypothetical protein
MSPFMAMNELRNVSERSSGALRFLLPVERELDAPGQHRLAEICLDQRTEMAPQADVDARHARGRELPDDVLDDRSVADRYQRLRQHHRVRP